jgi:hypothetical protein
MASAAELIAPGVRLRIGDGWEGRAETLHGIFVTHVGSGLTIHVRGWSRPDPRAELFAQSWPGPPADVIERVVGARRVVAGTFATTDGRFVREWFVSDGTRAANAGMPFDASADLSVFEQLVDSIELV